MVNHCFHANLATGPKSSLLKFFSLDQNQIQEQSLGMKVSAFQSSIFSVHFQRGTQKWTVMSDRFRRKWTVEQNEWLKRNDRLKTANFHLIVSHRSRALANHRKVRRRTKSNWFLVVHVEKCRRLRWDCYLGFKKYLHHIYTIDKSVQV